MGKLLHGDDAARTVSGRIGGSYADVAAVRAIPAERRQNGMLVAVSSNNSLWMFDDDSVIAASATILAPDAGTGRWINLATGAVA